MDRGGGARPAAAAFSLSATAAGAGGEGAGAEETVPAAHGRLGTDSRLAHEPGWEERRLSGPTAGGDPHGGPVSQNTPTAAWNRARCSPKRTSGARHGTEPALRSANSSAGRGATCCGSLEQLFGQNDENDLRYNLFRDGIDQRSDDSQQLYAFLNCSIQTDFS
ncbi:unnamed protein product [Coccothraustes coccothraustes]